MITPSTVGGTEKAHSGNEGDHLIDHPTKDLTQQDGMIERSGVVDLVGIGRRVEGLQTPDDGYSTSFHRHPPDPWESLQFRLCIHITAFSIGFDTPMSISGRFKSGVGRRTVCCISQCIVFGAAVDMG